MRLWSEPTAASSATAPPPLALPVKVTGLSHVTGIAARYNAAVATATNGISAVTSVWTSGANDHGQLGDGTLADHSPPNG